MVIVLAVSVWIVLLTWGVDIADSVVITKFEWDIQNGREYVVTDPVVIRKIARLLDDDRRRNGELPVIPDYRLYFRKYGCVVSQVCVKKGGYWVTLDPWRRSGDRGPSPELWKLLEGREWMEAASVRRP